jgi:tetratricopeptide (TPR) repeat protein
MVHHIRFTILAALMLVAVPLSAEPVDLTHASQLERQLFADARDGALDDYTMIDAALIASGLPDEDALSLYRKKYKSLLSGARRIANREDTDYARARSVFEYLHKKTLETYGLHSVDMVGVFSRGDYNCVSATILYNALLGDMSIESWGVLVPSHAYSIVQVDGRAVEVETTSPRGFDPARTDEAYRQLLKQYGLDGALYDANGGKRKRSSLIKEVQGEKKPVGNLTMVAVIYSNLAAARVRDGDLEGALANFVKASALSDENPHFQRSRDALLNNLIVDLVEAGSHQQAARAASAARQIPGLGREMLDKLISLQVHATTKKAVALAAVGKHKEGVAVYSEALLELRGQKTLLHNRQAGYVSWGISLNSVGRHREASTALLQALTLYPDAPVVQNNYMATVQKYIRSRRAAGDLDHAVKIARFGYEQAAAIFRQGGNPANLLFHLQLEIGLLLFAQQDFAAAIEYIVPGLETGEDIYVTNYLAASGNLARQFMEAGKNEEAFIAVAAAVKMVGEGVAAKHGFHKSYWPAAISYSMTLRQGGKAADALQIATSFESSTITSRESPYLYRSYWQERVSILAAMGRNSDCRTLLNGLADTGDTGWLERLRSQCSK